MHLRATCVRPITLHGRKSSGASKLRGNYPLTCCSVIGWRFTVSDRELIKRLHGDTYILIY